MMIQFITRKELKIFHRKPPKPCIGNPVATLGGLSKAKYDQPALLGWLATLRQD